jgi:hypothetical protein
MEQIAIFSDKEDKRKPSAISDEDYARRLKELKEKYGEE